MTAEGPTGAPLRQQIAEAIGQNMGLRKSPAEIADAVVALLNLTEEHAWGYDFDEDGYFEGQRFVTPWLPSTPPDTSSVTQKV